MNENYKDEIRREIRRIELENEESIRRQKEIIWSHLLSNRKEETVPIWPKVEMRDKLLRSKFDMAEGIGETGVPIWPGGYNFTPVIDPNFELRYDGDKSSPACYNGDTFDLPTRKDERSSLFWHGMDE